MAQDRHPVGVGLAILLGQEIAAERRREAF